LTDFQPWRSKNNKNKNFGETLAARPEIGLPWRHTPLKSASPTVIWKLKWNKLRGLPSDSFGYNAIESRKHFHLYSKIGNDVIFVTANCEYKQLR